MKLVKIALGLAVVAALAAAGGLFVLSGSAVTPAKPVIVEIPRGTGTQGIANLLAKEGLIASPTHFLAARVLKLGAKLQAGRYEFKDPASAAQILDRLAKGDVYLASLTIPEGSNIWDVAEIASKLGWFTKDEFLEQARNKALVAELLPELKPTPDSFEGYLFPSTYRLSDHMTPRQVIAQMTGQFQKVWAAVRGDNPGNVPVQEAVSLAAMVETEARLPEERPIVASVYRNRVDLGMFLGCDPTVIYAALLEGRYRGKIYQSDLDSLNPYNTYKVRGLPPGPIASPGEASLRAALKPANTKFLYFVAKGDGSGGHTFSANAAQHNRAVAEYRRNVR